MTAQEAEALQAEVKLLQAEAGQLRRNNELKSEVEAQCGRRGAAQVIIRCMPSHKHYLYLMMGLLRALTTCSLRCDDGGVHLHHA